MLQEWKKYNSLTIKSFLWYKYWAHLNYLCECECWNITQATHQQLVSGTKRSCWCNRIWINSTHKMSKTRIYKIWASIKRRCDKWLKHYGSRWITYCDSWKSFENFYSDMKEWYDDSLSIDRIDVNWNYCKENCRWATPKQQANNKTTNRFITIEWDTKTVSQWLDFYKISKNTFYSRITEQWMNEKDALLKSIKKRSPLISYDWKSMPLVEWSKFLWIKYKTLYRRLYIVKISVDDAFKI